MQWDVRQINVSGSSTPKYHYDAFGNQRDGNEKDPNPFRYCGEYYDAETEEVYLRARYYNTATGRFGAEDSVKDGTNWYRYCGYSPVMKADPSGQREPDIWTGDIDRNGNKKGSADYRKPPRPMSIGDLREEYYNPSAYYERSEAISNAINNGAAPIPALVNVAPEFSNMLFKEDNRIEVPHGRYGWVRGGGSVFHSGLDISTLGNKTVHSTVSGTVWRIVPNEPGPGSDRTWEWGAYIVILDDEGNYHLFAHCENNSFQGLKTGERVEAGQPIAIMGMTGNANTALYATGQGAHVHYEVRVGSFSPGASVNPSPWAGIPGSSNTPNIGGQVGSWYRP